MVTEINLRPPTEPIETATSLETAIEIISSDFCEAGIREMQDRFVRLFPIPTNVSVIPILFGGKMVGEKLLEPFGITPNPMRMSNYGTDTKRLEHPICLIEPDIDRIVRGDLVLPVLFTEAVVETQGSLLAAMEQINKMIDQRNRTLQTSLAYPQYYTFALASKTGDRQILVPNLNAMFKVDDQIWLFGMGCDYDGDQSRGIERMGGILSPFHTRIPKRPYFTPLFDVTKH